MTQISKLRRHTLALLALLSVAGAASAAAAAPPSPSNVLDGILADADPVPELSTSGLRAAMAEVGTLLLDSRPYAEYAISHIPGARSVPSKAGVSPSQYVADVNEVIRSHPDRSQRIILYCNGLHCGRSKRFGAELLKAGYQHVQRYQLGIPAWRALGGVTEVDRDALLSLLERDQTAVLIDARKRPVTRPLRGAQQIPIGETKSAKDDGRLPMTDHNTRIFVVGATGVQARAVAEAIVRDAFHNVAFFGGSVAELPKLMEASLP